MKTFVAICLFMILAFVVLLFRLTVSTFVTGEKALIYKSQTGTKVFFQRTRSALASAEYERSLIVVSNGGKTTRFQLPDDGGDRSKIKVSKHTGTSGHVFIGIWDSPKSLDYLVDVETHKAYSVFYYDSDLGTLPQYALYQGAFTNHGGVWASSKAELTKYNKKAYLLEDLIEPIGVILGTIDRDSGALELK